MNNQLKLLLYILFVAAVLLYFQNKIPFLNISIDNEEEVEFEQEQKQEEKEKEYRDDAYVEIDVTGSSKIKVNVEIADNQLKRTLGLSNRRTLGDYDGMFFIFDEDTNTSFWMKDMYISLDIIFIDKDLYIVDIKENQEPCTEYYCPNIYSISEYRYVLEVNAGFSKLNNIDVGKQITQYLAQ